MQSRTPRRDYAQLAEAQHEEPTSARVRAPPSARLLKAIGGPDSSASAINTANIDQKLKHLEMKLLRRRDLYTHAGDHYRRWYRCLTIPTLILTASTGLVSSAWPEAENEEVAEQWKTYRTFIVSSLSAMATVLVSVNSLLKYESTHIAFFKAAQQCDTLSTKIGFISQYNVVRKKDLEIQSIMSQVEKDLIEISSYVPPIPSWLIKQFRDAAKAANMKHVLASGENLSAEAKGKASALAEARSLVA